MRMSGKLGPMRSVLSAGVLVGHTASGLNWNLSLSNSSDAVAMNTVYTISLIGTDAL